MSDLLSVTFTATNAVRGKRPYTIYEIEVRSSNTLPWLLYKRYRDFDQLHTQLLKLMATNEKDMDFSNIRLNLPPKRLVRSRAPDVIKKRQKMLEEYLHKILSNQQLMRNPLILEFLTVPERLRAMLMRRKVDAQSSGQSLIVGAGAVPEEEREVNLLLKELSLQKNRVRALGKFERWYFEKAMQKKERGEPLVMGQQVIRRLFIGDDARRGLVHSCRLFHSRVAWRASISLLVRLLDIERNKYARIFQEVFLSLPRGLYKEMYLHQHIKETSQEDGFKIVQLIEDNLPDLDHKFYVPDDSAWRQYQKWRAMQRDNFGVIGGGKSGGMSNEWVDDDENDLKLAFNWKEMEFGEISEAIMSGFRELSAESDEKFMMVATERALRVRYRKDLLSQRWKLKISFAVKHPPRDVYEFLVQELVHKEWSKRERDRSWNKKVVSQRKHRVLDDRHFVVHQIFKKFNSPFKFSDFVLLICLRPDVKTKRFVIAFASIANYDDLAENNNAMNAQRATLLPSGFEIRATRDNPERSHVSYRAHMTNESVLTVSADLLGETDELFQSMLGIEKLITASHSPTNCSPKPQVICE